MVGKVVEKLDQLGRRHTALITDDSNLKRWLFEFLSDPGRPAASQFFDEEAEARKWLRACGYF